jgi:hypothetical protein
VYAFRVRQTLACFVVVTAFSCTSERVFTPLELPFDVKRVATIEARGMPHEWDVWREGALHFGYVPPDEDLTPPRKLDSAQSAILYRALTSVFSAPDVYSAMCFMPHHFFSVRDRADQELAAIDVCFTCENIRVRGPAFERLRGMTYPELLLFTDLVVELDLQNFVPDWYYARYPRRH